jgi:DNA-binding transcriptional ArsR family regulator
MSRNPDNPYSRLERIFHEPARLIIMSQLLGTVDGVTFTDLRDACGLTDGNLSRHLTALERAKAIRIDKSFAGHRPQTRVCLSPQGREDFMAYLQALESVLLDAADKVAARPGRPASLRRLFGRRLARA